ncbi:hypothetical protein LVJ94_01195 [Pendulispora rubella]|uniref:Uncharacterized protein n=1 Tax=Pendulispora rubella TaxID=2741070 RepID=A0ABZ2L7G8_9BACT
MTDSRAELPAAAPAPKCFHTYAEATSFATKGRVHLPKDATFEEVDEAVERSARSAAPLAEVVIAREYEHAGFRYPSLAVTASSGCNTGNKYYSSMPQGWNDTISSALIYGGTGCFHGYHYEHGNFGGASLDVGAGVDNMGALNDKTSSILWTP